jgi:aspartate carbamoyltransferase regulatory subunit
MVMKIKKRYFTAVVSYLMVFATFMFISSTAYAQTNKISDEKLVALQQKAFTNLANSILKIQEMPVVEEDIRRIEQFLPGNIMGIMEEIITISKSNAPIEEKVDTIIKTYDSSCYDYVIASIVADALYYFLCVRAPGDCGPFAFLDEISYVTWALAVLCFYGVL